MLPHLSNNINLIPIKQLHGRSDFIDISKSVAILSIGTGIYAKIVPFSCIF